MLTQLFAFLPGSPSSVAHAADSVTKYCKNNSTEVTSVSLTASSKQVPNGQEVTFQYTATHREFSSSENIGYYLLQTRIVNGQETQPVQTQVGFVQDLDSRKESPTRSKGTFNEVFVGNDKNGTYKYVLLAYGPRDLPGANNTPSPEQLTKNRCSSVVDVTVKVGAPIDPNKVATPTGLSAGSPVPGKPDSPSINLSFRWEWTSLPAGAVPTFEMVYSTPSDKVVPLTELTGPSADKMYSKQLNVLDPKGKNKFGVRAVVNGQKSDVSQEVSVDFDANGQLIQFVDINGNVTTREQVLAADPIIGGGNSGRPCVDVGPGNFMYALHAIMCEVTVVMRNMGIFVLTSAGVLLGKTAGLNVPEEESKNSLFGWVQGTALDGKVEDKLVDSQMGAVSRAAYARVLNLVNSAILLLFIIIALANILQIQVNAYSFKKLLPGLIIGLLLANASYFIVRAGLELSGSVADGLISRKDVNDSGGNVRSFLDTFKKFGTVDGDITKPLMIAGQDGDLRLVFQQAVLNLFLWAAAILVLILALLFAFRSLIFFFAVPLAPLAFLGLYFPPLGFVWKRWSGLMVNWIFMPVVAFFWLWLGFLWFRAVASVDTGFFAYTLGYIFGIAMFWLAVKTPFSLAGEAKFLYGKLESKLNAAPGKLWGATWGASGGAALDVAGRKIKTAAYEKDKLGLLSIGANLKRMKEADEERLKAAKSKGDMRGIGKWATKAENRAKAYSDLSKKELEIAEHELLEHDSDYMNMKARISVLGDVVHEMEEHMKDEIRIRKNTNKELADARKQHDELKKQAILMNFKAERSDTFRTQEFEESMDPDAIEKRITAPLRARLAREGKSESEINNIINGDSELQQQIQREKLRAAQVKRARVEADAAKTAREKIIDKSKRGAIIDMQNEFGNYQFVDEMMKQAEKGSLSSTQIKQTISALSAMEEVARKQNKLTHATRYKNLREGLERVRNDPTSAKNYLLGAKDEYKATRNLADDGIHEKGSVDQAIERSLGIRIAIEDSKAASERAKDIFKNGEVLERVSKAMEVSQEDREKGARSIVESYTDVLAGRGSQVDEKNDENFFTITAAAEALNSRDYVAADVRAVQQMLKGVQEAYAQDAENEQLIAATANLRQADDLMREALGKALQGKRGGKLRNLGVTDSMGVQEFLAKMENATGQDRADFVSVFQGSGASRLLYLDRQIANAPSYARGPRPKAE